MMNAHTRPNSLRELPPDIQYVWHGVNDRANLRHFLASPIEWAELDVNLSADGRRLILRHDTYAELPPWEDESELLLEDAMAQMADKGRSIKLDFKVGGPRIDQILSMVDAFGIGQDKLWFNGNLDLLNRNRIAELSIRYPGAIIQLPLSSAIVPEMSVTDIPETLAALTEAGVNRWSVGWRYPARGRLIEMLNRREYAFNIYGVADLEEFLAALELQPTSVTADFNFPAWDLHGRGSGHRGFFHPSDA